MNDEQITRCFGKYRSCAQECRLKSVCLDKFRELEDERRRRRYRETEYIDGMDASGGHVSPEFSSGAAAEELNEIIAAIEQLDVSDQCRDALLRIAQKKDDREKLETDMLAMLRKLGEIYVCDPVGFEVLFFQVLAGGSQAALARRRGCTKQNVNKSIARGRIRIEAYRRMAEKHPGCRLSPRELAVFHAVELEGMTCREAAAILGCSKSTIAKVGQKLREKDVKMDKKQPGRRKGNKKATALRRSGGLKVKSEEQLPVS